MGRQTVEESAVDTGAVRIEPDGDRPRGFTLVLDGHPQSHVDLDDPAYLLFEYVRRLGHVVDLVAAPGVPVNVLHLGGGALTLPRYVAATRPRSRQAVVEIDAALVSLVRRRLPLRRDANVRVRIDDARAGLTKAGESSVDLVVCDVFSGGRVPATLSTVEVIDQVRRVLRPGGVHAFVAADGPPLAYARRCAATFLSSYASAAQLAEPPVLRGRRFGNVLLLGSDGSLPLDGLVRRVAADPVPARVVAEADLRRFAGTASALTDADPMASPPPPAGPFTRR